MSVCRVVMTGRVGRNPELAKTKDGIPVCRFSIAVEDNTKEREVTWWDITAWRAQAEFVSKWAKKGYKVTVDGKLRKFKKDKDGQTTEKVEVVADYVDITLPPKETYSKPENNVTEETYESFGSSGIDISAEDLPF